VNTRALEGRHAQRGFTLIEVFAALAVLAVSSLGLVAGLVIALRANGIAAQRTLMLQFAQTRLERLIAETRTKIPTAATTSPDCSKMTSSPWPSGTSGLPPPGTGGWMLDVIDGPAPNGAAGNDAMFGPVLIYDAANNATDNYIGSTIATRTSVYNAWVGGSLSNGCASTITPQSPGGGAPAPGQAAVLCREVHIEPQTVNGIPMLRAWVRVLQVGADWQVNSVTLTEDIAQ
jgi:prepilin-type N-terminal cleavage/methylation domain-containing protein